MGIRKQVQAKGRRLASALLGTALVLTGTVVVAPAAAASGTTYTVNSTADPGNGTCDATECTLREALLAAAADSTIDTIAFAIPGTGVHTIQATSDLGALKPVVIDGTTQPGYAGAPLIELDGANTTHWSGSFCPGGGMGFCFLPAASGSTLRGLIINGYGNGGVFISGDNVTIEGNYIGTDATGTLARPNGVGVTVRAASGAVIGGTTEAARNVISGNAGDGITAGGANHEPATTQLTVRGNYIGTTASGLAALGNQNGVILGTNGASSTGNTIADNVVSANRGGGISTGGDRSLDVTITGNIVGLDAAGDAPLGNGGFGIGIGGPGTMSITGNVLSGNSGYGVHLAASNATFQGNRIGTNGAGTAARGNGTGGMEVLSGSNLIGGTSPAEANTISGNTGSAIDMGTNYTNSDANRILGNFIGTNAAGAVLGNSGSGIVLFGVHGSTIGSIDGPNVIANNGGGGVVPVCCSDGMAVRANSIFANGGLGIDLRGDGVSPNDAGDADDPGANFGQNFPAIVSATPGAPGAFTIAGTLNSAASSTYSVDVYSSLGCDPTGNGEGQTYLGTASLTTNGAGDAGFSINVNGVPAGQNTFTSTATSATGDTSEFSPCMQGSAPAPNEAPTFDPATPVDVQQMLNPDGSPVDHLTFTVRALDQDTGDVVTVDHSTLHGAQQITQTPGNPATVQFDWSLRRTEYHKSTSVCLDAHDNRGLHSAGSYCVNVNLLDSDVTAPTVSVPADLSAAATGPSGASVAFSVSASDGFDPAPTVLCSRASGDTFPIGETIVSCSASDASENTSSARTFKVTVTNAPPPPALSITTSGSGSDTANAFGSVVSNPDALVSCSRTANGDTQGACSASYAPGTIVTVVANPAAGTTAALSGTGCTDAPGGPVSCDVTMDQARVLTATFTRDLPPAFLTIAPLGAGTDFAHATGFVDAAPGGGRCNRNGGAADPQTTCTFQYAAATAARVTATPTSADTAVALTGGCAAGPGAVGASVSCDVTMSEGRGVTATFTRALPTFLTLAPLGAGTDFSTATGFVDAAPGGGRCNRNGGAADPQTTCTFEYHGATVVHVTATPTSVDTTVALAGGCAAGPGAIGASVSCDVTMSEGRSVTATFARDLPPSRLTVVTAGAGSDAANAFGTVKSSPSGIDCARSAGGDTNGTCSASYADHTSVTVTATPGPGTTAQLAGPSGSTFCNVAAGASGAPVSCQVTMSEARDVTATFSRDLRLYTLTVTTNGDADRAHSTGSVTSADGRIACNRTATADSRGTCSATYPQGSTVTLTATGSAGTTAFLSGIGCSGVGPCVVTIDQARFVSASFTHYWALNITTAGAGTDAAHAFGAVSSYPDGITCSRTAAGNNQGSCSTTDPSDKGVTVTATPEAGTTAQLAGPAGTTFCNAGPGAAGAAVHCTFPINNTSDVTATFSRDLPNYLLRLSTSGDPDRSSTRGTLATTDGRTGCVRTANNDSGGTCVALYAKGSVVTVTATPAAVGTIASLSGDGCVDAPGGAVSCAVTMDQARTINASFTHPQTLRVATVGAGTDPGTFGTVGSAPSGIACARNARGNTQGACTTTHPSGAFVTVTATPAALTTTAQLAGPSGTSFCNDGPGAPGKSVSCSFPMTSARDVIATFSGDLPTYPLTVTTGASGTAHDDAVGTATSSPSGISCTRLAFTTAGSSGTCSASYTAPTAVTLTATPDAASTAALSGDCSAGPGAIGAPVSCQVAMSAARNVAATFGQDVPTFVLNVTTLNAGDDGANAQGTVASSVSGINCAETSDQHTQGTCSASYDRGTVVRLTATPAEGTFARLAGVPAGSFCAAQPAGAGIAVHCDVTMSKARDVVATFTRSLPRYALNVQVAGGGLDPAHAAGTVTSADGRINCSRVFLTNGGQGVCAAMYVSGTHVAITARPENAASTAMLAGSCSAGPGAPGADVQCDATVDQTDVIATFSRSPAFTTNPGRGQATTGQGIGITIDTPMQDKFVPAGPTTISGHASIEGASVLYVVDVSASTRTPTGLDCNGDQSVNSSDDFNHNGRNGETVDCEISGVIALNKSLLTAPNLVVGVESFASTAVTRDLDLGQAGDQHFVAPNSPGPSATASELYVNRVARTLVGDPAGSTNFDAALSMMATTLGERPAQEAKAAFFLSDGEPVPGTYTTGASSPIQRLHDAGIKVNTYSVGGQGAGCEGDSPMLSIAVATGGVCTVVARPGELKSVLGTTGLAHVVNVRLCIDGQWIGIAPVLADGTWSATLTLASDVRSIVAAVLASDGSTASAGITVNPPTGGA